METSILNGMCRCCALEGTFKDLKCTYHWMGEQEIYGDMLKECFNIDLSNEDGTDSGICEVCITQLRNAVNFKKQVLFTEEQFKKKVQGKFFKANIVKLEVQQDEADSDDNDNNLSTDEAFSNTEFEVPIKMEEPEEPKAKKRAAAKATTSRAKKAKTDAGETSKRMDAKTVTKGVFSLLPNVDGLQIKINKESKKYQENSGVKASEQRRLNEFAKEVGIVIKTLEKSSDAKPETEYQKSVHNAKVILRCTNATMIRKHDGLKYHCWFCVKTFELPEDLKQHTRDEHSRRKFRAVAHDNLKLDITNLLCRVCDEQLPTLEECIQHLITVHGLNIYTDIKSCLVPFKFEGNELRCVYCDRDFGKFRVLQEHMRTHFNNYVCDVCGGSFITNRQYRFHMDSHKFGTFPCETCSKVFDTPSKLKYHKRQVHDLYKANKCGHCGEKFLNCTTKEKHLATVHGIKMEEYKCKACDDKVYQTRSSLWCHIKKQHLMEKHYSCDICDQKFFWKKSLEDHMIKHTGVKDYVCIICTKAYARKKSLNEHMRIHKDDRRFKCETCGLAFVQKCSLRGHMKSKHGWTQALKTNESPKKIVTQMKNKNAFKDKINLHLILLFSNATLIQTKDSTYYDCFFCKEQFVEPADLKEHNLEEHRNKADIIKHCCAKLFENVVKVDITGLSCKICHEDIPSLSELTDHLKNIHNKQIFSNVKSQLIPFKFETEKLTCIECKQEFPTFKLLQEHMNCHFANYVCEVCGAGFVLDKLRASHTKVHLEATEEKFKCTQCPKTFTTLEKQNLHVYRMHYKGGKVCKCNLCGERFTDYWKKMEHLVEAHGMPSLESKCEVCGIVFKNRKLLTLHVRKDHLQERKYECDKCGKKFFSREGLQAHSAVHTDLRKYKCDVCSKSYKRMKNLHEHKKLHTGLLNHNCEYCKVGFVQKATWRSHMRSKHGEEV